MSIAPSLPARLAAKLRYRSPFARRSQERELLDGAALDPAELAANLRDLARLNRMPGGAAASIRAIEALTAAGQVSILDVGTGAGDMPRAFARHGARIGSRWRVLAVDNRTDVLRHAASVAQGDGGVTLMLADALNLPIDDASVDVAHGSLLLHHLDPRAAVDALREMARVARCGVVINDLRRGPLAFALAAPVVVAFGQSAMTRHDGLISLRRAYTLPEVDELLAEAGLEVLWRSNRFMPRVVTAAARRPDG